MIVSGIIRGVQILFAAVVLGLSIHLIKGQRTGNAPAITNYSAFTGGFGLIVAVVGIAALFVDALSGFIIMGVDALCALFYLAGGVVSYTISFLFPLLAQSLTLTLVQAVAVHLRGVSCGSSTVPNGLLLEDKAMLNGGCVTFDGRDMCGYVSSDSYGTLQARCRESTADSAFMFFGFAVCVGAVVAAFFSKGRSGGGRGGIV